MARTAWPSPIGEMLPIPVDDNKGHLARWNINTISVRALISGIQLASPGNHDALDNILTRYNANELPKTELRQELVELAGRGAVMTALTSMFPHIELASRIQRLDRLLDVSIDPSMLLPCCFLGFANGCTRVIEAHPDAVKSAIASAALASTLYLENFTPHSGGLSMQARTQHSWSPQGRELMRAEGHLQCATLLLNAGVRVDSPVEIEEKWKWCISDIGAHYAGLSPVEIAEKQWRNSELIAGSAAALVIAWHHGWTTHTHRLFPAPMRSRARDLIRLGHLLSREPKWVTESGAVIDVWHIIMRFVLVWPERAPPS